MSPWRTQFRRLTLVAGLSLAAGTAQASCLFNISTPGGRLLNFDPFSPSFAIDPFQIELRGEPRSVVEFQLVAPDSIVGTDGVGPEPFRIVSPQDTAGPGQADRTIVVPSANFALPRVRVTLRPNGTANANLRFIVEKAPDEVLAAGTYREDLLVAYRCGDSPSAPTEFLAQTVPIEVRVESSVRAGVGSLDALAGAINLGVIPESGSATGSVPIQLASTDGFRLRAERLLGGNTWFMRRLGLFAPGPLERIPYSVQLGDVAVQPGSRLRCGRSPTGRQELDLAVTTDQDAGGGVVAGTYADAIILTVTPDEGSASRGCQLTGNAP